MSFSIDEVNGSSSATSFPKVTGDTVGRGSLYHLLGHVPEEGEAADFDGHRLVAQKVDGRRIARVLIGVSAPWRQPRVRLVPPWRPSRSPSPDGAEEQP